MSTGTRLQIEKMLVEATGSPVLDWSLEVEGSSGVAALRARPARGRRAARRGRARCATPGHGARVERGGRGRDSPPAKPISPAPLRSPHATPKPSRWPTVRSTAPPKPRPTSPGCAASPPSPAAPARRATRGCTACPAIPKERCGSSSISATARWRCPTWFPCSRTSASALSTTSRPRWMRAGSGRSTISSSRCRPGRRPRPCSRAAR